MTMTTRIFNIVKSIPTILWTISIVTLVVQIAQNCVDRRFIIYLLSVAFIDICTKKYLGAILGILLSAILAYLMVLGIV